MMPLRWATEKDLLYIDDALREPEPGPRVAHAYLLTGSLTRLWLVGIGICVLAGVVLATVPEPHRVVAVEPYRVAAVACFVLSAVGLVFFVRWYFREDWQIPPRCLRFDGQAGALYLRSQWGIRVARGLVLTPDGIELRDRGTWATREWSAIDTVTVGGRGGRRRAGRRRGRRRRPERRRGGRRRLFIDVGGDRTLTVTSRRMGPMPTRSRCCCASTATILRVAERSGVPSAPSRPSRRNTVWRIWGEGVAP